MNLYKPVKPWIVTQFFGETANISFYKTNGVNFKGHNGMDILTKHGQPVYASHDGVAFWEEDPRQGCGVVLCAKDFKTIYWHLCDGNKEPKFKSPIQYKTAVKISAGDLIGYADNTGLSTADHLHFGLKFGTFNEATGVFINSADDNGYYGASDPKPHLVDMFAVELGELLVKIVPLRYKFTLPMSVSADYNKEVEYLQMALMNLNYLPVIRKMELGYYGKKTADAVFLFQKDHVQLSLYERFVMRGNRVGPKTLAALNLLFDK